MEIVRCMSCDGYGWFEEDGITEDCDWCGGIGYVYRDPARVDHQIPKADYDKVASVIDDLETQRMRDLGYTGEKKHPKDQEIRKRKP